jgi:outer membrane lipoprotein-sorting protein
MKNLAAILFTILVASVGMTAQDSDKILDELSAKAKGYTSIYAEYENQLLDEKAGLDITQKGSITVQGEKYNLNLADYVIINNGEDFWSYDSESNTCMIDLAEDMADESFSPGEMFTIWEQDFKNEYKGAATVGSADCHHINLYPNNPVDKPYHTIQLYIDKSKMEVVKIVVKGREGNDMIYVVKKFTPNIAINVGDFAFDVEAHPGVEMIDNR